MKVWSLLVAVLALTMVVGIADAAKGNKGGKANLISGEITAIDGANVTVQPKAPKNSTDKPAAVVVVTNDSTAVMINDVKKNASDLGVGQKVKITLDADGKTATNIAVQTKGARKAGKGGADAPATPAPAAAPAAEPAK